MEWTYNEQSETWLYGTDRNGCGVFNEKGQWACNVVYGNHLEFLPAQDTKENAQRIALARLMEIREDPAFH